MTAPYPQTLRRRQRQRSRRVVNGKRANASIVARLLFLTHALILRRASAAFVNEEFTSRSLRSTTRRTDAPFANDRRCQLAERSSPSGLHESCDDSSISWIDAIVTRRASLASAAGIAATFIPRNPTAAAAADDDDDDNASPPIPSLTIPLQYRPALSAYTVSYKVGTSTFGAIVDTGSPFLLVPRPSETSCRPEYEWGCLREGESVPAPGLDPTVERFDGNEGRVEWRKGRFSFLATTAGDEERRNEERVLESVARLSDASLQSLLFPRSLMTFGVISESLMDGPGGIFLGLVKDTDDRIRPSFLGQSDVTAFSVDLREKGGIPKSLTFYAGGTASTEARGNLPSHSRFGKANGAGPGLGGTLPAGDAIPLVRDLNKRFGDPTIHYVGVASSIAANGSTLATSRRGDKIYCILDTGCTGMSISPSLFDERYAAARSNHEKSLWGKVDVELTTVSGGTVNLTAARPITTPLGSERPWGRRLEGHLVVLGLSFLEGKRMTVDADGGRVWFED